MADTYSERRCGEGELRTGFVARDVGGLFWTDSRLGSGASPMSRAHHPTRRAYSPGPKAHCWSGKPRLCRYGAVVDWWKSVLAWISTWNGSQGFWTAVQGIGTVIAAVAALVALIIAGKQLGELIRSNNLLAASNDAMTRSNVALTRPYVVVDFQFRPFVDREGTVRSTTITVHVENAGRTPAKNLTLKVDPPFPVPQNKKQPAWAEGVAELNKAMNGETVIRSLTPIRPLSYYLDEADDIMGTDETPAGHWRVTATYQDAEGRTFSEESVLELSHWRRAMVTVDPMYRIAKGVQAVAYQVKEKKLPSLNFEFPAAPRPRVAHPRTRATSRRLR